MHILMQTPIAVTVTAADRASMESRLDDAVDLVRTEALKERSRGILVTRHDYRSFTVILSDKVPFGLTREHQEW